MTVGIREEREGEPGIGNLGGWDDGPASELLGPVQSSRVVDLDIEPDPALSAALAGADPAGDSFLASFDQPVARIIPCVVDAPVEELRVEALERGSVLPGDLEPSDEWLCRLSLPCSLVTCWILSGCSGHNDQPRTVAAVIARGVL